MTKNRKDLVLGDYITVHVSNAGSGEGRRNFGPPADILEKHAAFFQRIMNERKELTPLERRKAA